MIEFRKLEITSFKGIYHCILDFQNLNRNFYSLEGKNTITKFATSNGAGKSTLIQALCFVLYGSVDDLYTKNSEYQNKNTKIPLKLTLNLNIQDIEYNIERTLSSFKLFKEGEDISELTKTDTEKKFQSILNLTKAEFCNFTYLSQSASSSFLSKTPAEKLNCIKDFVFGDELLSIQTRLDNTIKQIKSEEYTVKQNQANLTGSIETLNTILERKNSNIVKEVHLPFTIEEYQQQLDDFKREEKRIISLSDSKSNVVIKFKQLKQQYDRSVKELETVNRNVCPTCGQHLKDKEVQNKLETTIKDKKAKLLYYKNDIERINNQLSQCADLNLVKDTIEQLRNNIAKLKAQNEVSIDYDKIQEEIDIKTKELKQDNKLLEELQLQLTQLTKLQTYFKTDFIQTIQQAFLTEIENYLNIYCFDIFGEPFKLNLNKNSLELTVGGKSYSYFSGGERQRLDFIFVFAIKLALTHFTDRCTNLFICDESLSGQDGQSFENCVNLVDNLSSNEDLITILVSHRDIEYQKNKIIVERLEKSTNLEVIEL